MNLVSFGFHLFSLHFEAAPYTTRLLLPQPGKKFAKLFNSLGLGSTEAGPFICVPNFQARAFKPELWLSLPLNLSIQTFWTDLARCPAIIRRSYRAGRLNLLWLFGASDLGRKKTIISEVQRKVKTLQ